MSSFREFAEMMRNRAGVFLGIMIMAVGCATSACRAGFTFLGPTPYRSAADSPFPVDGTNPNFLLEDFEDGELNTPGIFQPVTNIFGTLLHGTVLGPGGVADSVDADDGVVDGFNPAGYSLRSGFHLKHSTWPPSNQFSLDFEFSKDELGYLPNAVGFVLTDLPTARNQRGLAVASVRVTDAVGDLHILPSVPIALDNNRNGKVVDDLFLGVMDVDAGIASFSILGVVVGEIEGFDFYEIDHLQYGLLPIPEPATLMPFVFGMYFGFLLRFARKQPSRERRY